MTIGLNWYLALSAILFCIGAAGVLTRRNLLIVLMSLELMLNAVNLTLVAFSRFIPNVDGQVIVFFVMAVAAAEAAVGLALVVALFRHKGGVDADRANLMKW